MAPAQPRQQRRGPVLAVPQLQPPLLRAAVAGLAIEVSTKFREFHNIRKRQGVLLAESIYTVGNRNLFLRHYAKHDAFFEYCETFREV